MTHSEGHQPRGIDIPSGSVVKDAAASRRRTCGKSAGFHLGAQPLSNPLQAGIRFLPLPLPTTSTPRLTRWLPHLHRRGDALGLPRFPRRPPVGGPVTGLGTHYLPGAVEGNESRSMILNSTAPYLLVAAPRLRGIQELAAQFLRQFRRTFSFRFPIPCSPSSLTSLVQVIDHACAWPV